jgi:hypothetical protein
MNVSFGPESAARSIVAPARTNLLLGKGHRVTLSNVPGIDAPVESSLELPVSTGDSAAFLRHNAIPLQLTSADVDTLTAGNALVKIAYLPTSRGTAAGPPAVETVVSSRFDPDNDPLEEAKKRGTVLAVWRISSAASGLLRIEGSEMVKLFAEDAQGQTTRKALPTETFMRSEQAQRYRVSFTSNPRTALTAELQFPKLEPETLALLSLLKPSILISDADVKTALQGERVVRVFFVIDTGGRPEINVVSSGQVAGEDPVEVAKRRGKVFAIWRIEPPKASDAAEAAPPADNGN